LFVASAAGATSPERYAEGLRAQIVVDPRGTDAAMLRPAPSGRVRIAGGTFTMGSSPVDMLRGVQLCQREPLGSVTIPRVQNNSVVRVSIHCDFHRFEAEALAHSVTLRAFSIDRTEVRVADYMRCVTVGRCAVPGFTPGDPRFSQPDLPVVLVSWEDARDYCSYAKGRLPTEAEWELAARGVEGRTFPWGDVWNGHLANHGALALDRTDASDGFAGLAPVGSFPDGKTALGVLDMAGNAAEWVADAYDEDVFLHVPPSYPPVPETNPHHEAGAQRVFRGGSYLDGAADQRSANRYMTYPTQRMADVGFRCASDEP
jgi:formylglycine-generating enzyme required for sulfatase activity